MGRQYRGIPRHLKHFIEKQKIYFVATAASDGRVNVSPKGMDSLRVLGSNRVVWLNLTGSGNETSAHVQEDPRMTLMFAAFEGEPMILRLYGNARVVHRKDADWDRLAMQFDPIPGARQIFDVEIDLVQTSCGMAVPFFDYAGEREQLRQWVSNKGEQGLVEYWEKNNQISLDGKPTHIMTKSL